MTMSDTDHPSSITDPSGLPDEENGALARTEKGPLAFRTISEVADELHVPQHVLRFWETRFEQVRPLKRGGGRRYYRPADVELLRHISDLLYAKGYTVKGVQRLLREGEAEAAQQSPAVT
ncbi:MAG: MerR family transcriptional regulator, partial [Acetobacter malorum]